MTAQQNAQTLTGIDKHLIFGLNNNLYAMSVAHVRSINIEERFEQMIGSGDHIKGVITYLGDVIQVMSMRSLFGVPPYEEELRALMRLRADDHTRWMQALEDSVRNETEFTLATDPHQCAFGKWYDAFETDSNALAMHLQAISKPHRQVHETAIAVKSLMLENRKEEALAHVQQARETCYAETMQLIAKTVDVYVENVRELVIIYDIGGKRKAILVDNILSVDSFIEFYPLPDILQGIPYFDKLARTKSSDNIVTLLNMDAM